MFLLEPNRTAYDLHFRVFSTEVRVHPLFWLVSALLGWSTTRQGMGFLVLWIGCVFVSILLHELGHVVMGRLFGSDGYIVLYSFGGLAVGSNNLARRWQRVLVSFAGPLVQLVLSGILFGPSVGYLWVTGEWLVDPRQLPPLVLEGLWYLFWINLVWAILNLFPIWPLDGGKISREFFTWLMPERGTWMSLGVSFLVAGLLAVNALVVHNSPTGQGLIPYLAIGGVYTALMFGLLAIQSFQMMQLAQPRRPWDEDRLPWER